MKPLQGNAVLAEAVLEQTDSDDSRHGEILLDSIIPYLINRLAFQMNRLLSKDLRKQGLQISHWRIFAVLDTAKQSTINELSAYAMIEQPTVSRLVARMEERGLVRRERIDSDGRVVRVSVTDEGRRTYGRARALALAHADRALTGMDEREKQRFRDSLLRVVGNLEKIPVPDL